MNNKVVPIDMFLSSTNIYEENNNNNLPVDFIYEISEFILSLPIYFRKRYYTLKKYKRFIKELQQKHKERLKKIDEEWNKQVSMTLEETSIKIIDIDNFL